MSSTNETQFYGLTQYSGSDKPAWTDNNEAFRKVDADLHSAKVGSDAASEAIVGIRATVAQLGEAQVQFQSDLNEANGKITTLQGRVTELDGEISGVKADALDMICAYNEEAAQSTHAYSVGDYFRYNDILYKATQSIAVNDTIVPNVNCSATNVAAELEAGDLPTAGDTRFNVSTGKLQYYNGITWIDYVGGETMLLDFDNAVTITSTYTTEAAGALVATLLKSSDSQASAVITVDGKNVMTGLAGELPAHDGIVYGIDNGAVIALTNVWQFATVQFVPYK